MAKIWQHEKKDQIYLILARVKHLIVGSRSFVSCVVCEFVISEGPARVVPYKRRSLVGRYVERVSRNGNCRIVLQIFQRLLYQYMKALQLACTQYFNIQL
jgi:hypothetical protein